MKDLTALFDSMLDVAKAVAPMIPGGELALNAGTKVVEMIDHAADAFAGTDIDDAADAKLTDLIASRDALERDVNAHVDRTVKALRGEG